MHQEVKQKTETRTSDYVCVKCGVEYLTDKQKQESCVATFHVNNCGLCGEWTGVTHIRSYNYLKTKNNEEIQ